MDKFLHPSGLIDKKNSAYDSVCCLLYLHSHKIMLLKSRLARWLPVLVTKELYYNRIKRIGHNECTGTGID
ncbi:MAG: hypothetical protein ABI288_02780 [Ginsengibacter sp.]